MNIFITLSLAFLAVCAVSTVYIFYSFKFANFSKKVYVLNEDDFEKKLIEAKSKQLIDVRTSWEFNKYRIAGAINMEYPGVSFNKQIKTLDKTKPVMVYCHSGYRSKMVLPILSKAGFKTIYELDKGITSWVRSGKPTE